MKLDDATRRIHDAIDEIAHATQTSDAKGSPRSVTIKRDSRGNVVVTMTTVTYFPSVHELTQAELDQISAMVR